MRVAVIGSGRMGRERAKAATSFGVHDLWLFDEDRSRAELLAQECQHAHVLGSLDELFRDEPDALFVCTPPHCRGPLELRAIQSRMPFFVEKPVGVTAEQVQPILEQLKYCPVLNAVGYMNRYRNSVLHARAVLRSRTLLGMAAHWIGRKYAVPWWSVRELSGGPFNEQATHLMDLFRFLAGSVEPVNTLATGPDGAETTVLALLRLAGGAVGSFLYSCEAKEKDILIAIETPEGVLELRGWDLELVRNTIDGVLPEAEPKPIFEKETHAFLQAVATGDGQLILADFSDACQTQLAMDRAVRMMQSARQAATST